MEKLFSVTTPLGFSDLQYLGESISWAYLTHMNGCLACWQLSYMIFTIDSLAVSLICSIRTLLGAVTTEKFLLTIGI